MPAQPVSEPALGVEPALLALQRVRVPRTLARTPEAVLAAALEPEAPQPPSVCFPSALKSAA